MRGDRHHLATNQENRPSNEDNAQIGRNRRASSSLHKLLVRATHLDQSVFFNYDLFFTPLTLKLY